MKTSKIFLNKFLIPLTLTILTPAATAIGSKLITGKWNNWFLNVPKWLWIIFILIIILWFFIILFKRRMKHLRELDKPSACFYSIPLHGWTIIGKLPYKNVIWNILIPAELQPSQSSASDIEIGTPPRCPKCQTEIEEKRSFWKGFIWICVRCGFRKRNKDSYYLEADRAEKIAKREFEIKLEEFLKSKQQ